ncbi:GLUTAMINE DUMPER 3 [Spatholobus suberectus]|nr:GLUTAMINE DUMPER 3 [Spatholobus suberectus]
MAPAATSSLTSPPRSTWHSPVPYLFGGLAAMLGLIAFALLILACSYWKLSGQLQSEENAERDIESVGGEKQGDSANKDPVKVYEEKILVIMAGDEKPTFLATPKSSFSTHGVPNHSDKNLQNHVNSEKSEKEMENHLQQPASPQPQETQQQSQRQRESLAVSCNSVILS